MEMSGANVNEEVLAGPRKVTTVGHVLTSVAQRVQDQLGQLVEDLPSRSPDERCVRETCLHDAGHGHVLYM